MYGGGGIDPEVFIPGDSVEYNQAFHAVQNEVMPFLCMELLKGRISLSREPDWNKLNQGLMLFIQKGKPAYQLAEPMRKKLAALMVQNWHYIKSNGNPVSQAIEQGKDDAFIKSALSYFNGKIQLK